MSWSGVKEAGNTQFKHKYHWIAMALTRLLVLYWDTQRQNFPGEGRRSIHGAIRYLVSIFMYERAEQLCWHRAQLAPSSNCTGGRIYQASEEKQDPIWDDCSRYDEHAGEAEQIYIYIYIYLSLSSGCERWTPPAWRWEILDWKPGGLWTHRGPACFFNIQRSLDQIIKAQRCASSLNRGAAGGSHSYKIFGPWEEVIKVVPKVLRGLLGASREHLCWNMPSSSVK